MFAAASMIQGVWWHAEVSFPQGNDPTLPTPAPGDERLAGGHLNAGPIRMCVATFMDAVPRRGIEGAGATVCRTCPPVPLSGARSCLLGVFFSSADTDN